jgi:hypothetical protein
LEGKILGEKYNRNPKKMNDKLRLMINKISKIFNYFIISSLLILMSCFESDPLANYKNDDSIVFFSNYDKKIDFKNYSTYFIPDSVFVITNESIRASVRPTSLNFISLFKNSFESKKFKFVGKTQKPDLGITISRISDAKIGLKAPNNIYFNTYWNYPLFGTDGYEYPGYFKDYQINDIIWNIDVVDLKNAVKNDKLNVVWNVQIRGKNVFDEDTFGYLIEQSFKISTFLNND